MKNHSFVITQALDEFFEGLSSRKCARNLKKFSATKISHVSILNWVRKFTTVIDNFVKFLKPNLGSEQLTDETTIKTKKENHQLGIVLDKKSRFIIATKYWDKSCVSLTPEDIAELWNDVLEMHNPQEWITDGHKSYDKAFKKSFQRRKATKSVNWIKNITSKSKDYNYYIERVNRNLKDRLRTIYGFKATWSAKIILKGWVIYYNFIRPHFSLKNKTPAEFAGIRLNLGENNWLDLIKLSVSC